MDIQCFMCPCAFLSRIHALIIKSLVPQAVFGLWFCTVALGAVPCFRAAGPPVLAHSLAPGCPLAPGPLQRHFAISDRSFLSRSARRAPGIGSSYRPRSVGDLPSLSMPFGRPAMEFPSLIDLADLPSLSMPSGRPAMELPSLIDQPICTLE